MIKHTWFKTLIAVAVAGASCHVMANGLAVNEQSVSGMGTSFAGRSSSAQDASTVFGNPAGMSRLQRAEISGGVAAIWPETDIDTANTNGTSKGDIAPDAQVPFAYYVRPLNDQWHVGLGLYVPFGVISDYEKSFAGRGNGLYSKVQVTTLQPTFSYRINDRVAVGFGPTINKIDGKLTSNPTVGSGLEPIAPNAYVRIKGDDIAYGYNLGVLVDVTDRLAWGLSYRSKVEYELEGSVRFSGFPPAGFPLPVDGRHKGALDFTTPESVDTSVTYKANDKWTLYAGSTWTRWSRLKEIEAVYATGSVGEDLNWKNTWAHAIGVAYQVTPSVVLRSGFALDASPTTNEHRTVRIPVSNRKIYSLGLGWNIDQDWTVDVAYAYVDESKGQVNQTDAVGANYTAQYDNSAHGLGVQLTHRF